MSRAPVVLLGMAVAILGYAVLYNGMANLGSARFGGGPNGPGVGFAASLIPSRAPAAVPAKAEPGRPKGGSKVAKG